MSELNFENNDADSESIVLEQLSTTEVFNFLKRYHNDLYPIDQPENKTVRDRVYYETIVTLEKLHRCLQDVGDFIGYAKVDWQEACTQGKNSKKKQIIDFYNDLIIDVELMQFADKNYDFAPRVKAFIHFLGSEPKCLFKLNVQTTSWTCEDFPYEEIFQWVAKFKSFIEDRKRMYQDKCHSNNSKSHAKKIQKAISSAKRITQFIFLFKFDISKLADEELEEIILRSGVDRDLVNQSRNQKVQSLVDGLSRHRFGSRLPWLCRMTKVELELEKHVKLQIGLILDSSNRKIKSDDVIRSLQLEIRNELDHSRLRSFVTMEIVQIDQIFDHLGVSVIREINLPNKKKTALMLKWYMGVFYRVNEFILPLNYEVESKYYEGKVCLEINSCYVEKLEHKDQTTRKRTNFKKESSKRKEVDFSAIWNEKGLLTHLPDYFGSIHMFYAGLEYREDLSKEEIQTLQRLNLFAAYLSENNLDGLYDRLTMSKNPKMWPTVVQMFLSFSYKSLDCLFNLKQWVCLDLSLIQRKLFDYPTDGSFNGNISSQESMYDIVDIVTDLQKFVRNSEGFQHIEHDVKLVRKNSRFAQNYLNNSFKQNAMVLRFQVDNRDSNLDLKDLKQVFTQFIKRVGRAPKRMGADLDAYIGYFVWHGESYSVDFTAIFYTRIDVPDIVSLALENEWKCNISELSDEGLKVDCENLKFEVIPILQSTDSSLIRNLVINKGDKITNQIKKDLVTFYTAYEFFNGYTNIDAKPDKRPELFLRGRTRMSVAKSAEKKEPLQMVNDVQVLEADSMTDNADQNLESIMDNKMVDVEVKNNEPKNEEELALDDERQRKEKSDGIHMNLKERAEKIARTIEPL